MTNDDLALDTLLTLLLSFFHPELLQTSTTSFWLPKCCLAARQPQNLRNLFPSSLFFFAVKSPQVGVLPETRQKPCGTGFQRGLTSLCHATLHHSPPTPHQGLLVPVTGCYGGGTASSAGDRVSHPAHLPALAGLCGSSHPVQYCMPTLLSSFQASEETIFPC